VDYGHPSWSEQVAEDLQGAEGIFEVAEGAHREDAVQIPHVSPARLQVADLEAAAARDPCALGVPAGPLDHGFRQIESDRLEAPPGQLHDGVPRAAAHVENPSGRTGIGFDERDPVGLPLPEHAGAVFHAVVDVVPPGLADFENASNRILLALHRQKVEEGSGPYQSEVS
jgi:hypothetical protein